MNKMIALAAVAVLALAPSFAKAEDAAAKTTTTETHSAATHTSDSTVTTKEMTLKDGTKVSVEGDSVFVVGADGAKTPAPDGEHELADGTKLKTMGGKVAK